MIKVQISFSKDANLENVKQQLLSINNGDYEFHCCFLPRKAVEEKGWDTAIVDLLEETLGDKLHYQLEKYDTFSDMMSNIETERIEIANLVNRMFVLDSGSAEGVRKEIELFSNAKIILFP